MRKLLLLLMLLSFLPSALKAQSTTVSGNVTDTAGTAWANGTYVFQFVPGSNTPPVWTGGAFNPTAQVPGVMDGSGNYSQSLPSNTAITPVNSFWRITVCSATNPQVCFSATSAIAGTTQTFNVTPSAPSISPGANQTVYNTSEVGQAGVGAQIYVIGSGLNTCTAVSGSFCSSWTAVGNALPSSAGAHTFFGNNTGSTAPLQATVPIGTNDWGPNIYCVTTGSADAYVATLPVPATALTAGVKVTINPNFDNATGAPTVNISSLGATVIKKSVNGVLTTLVAGDIKTGTDANLQYDTNGFFELINPATARSMWPCAPQAGLSDTIDNTTSPTETLFTTVCKIPANTLIAGMLIDGQVGLDWTGTATVPNSTFKAYICPTQGSLTGCKNIYTGTTSAVSAGTFSAVLPIILIGRQAAGATSAISQQSGAGVGANTPFGRNSIAGNITNVPTNADLFIQFSYAIAANTAGNSATIRSLIFR